MMHPKYWNEDTLQRRRAYREKKRLRQTIRAQRRRASVWACAELVILAAFIVAVFVWVGVATGRL